MDLNKGISTPTAILLIVVVSAAVGVVIWQNGKGLYSEFLQPPSPFPKKVQYFEVSYQPSDQSAPIPLKKKKKISASITPKVKMEDVSVEVVPPVGVEIIGKDKWSISEISKQEQAKIQFSFIPKQVISNYITIKIKGELTKEGIKIVNNELKYYLLENPKEITRSSIYKVVVEGLDGKENGKTPSQY